MKEKHKTGESVRYKRKNAFREAELKILWVAFILSTNG